MLLAFHKPFGVLSQFTHESGSRHRTLSDFGFPPGVYPLGRLDAESEGLLLLSNDAELNARLLHPARGHRRVYWAQVERIPSLEALARLQRGVTIGRERTLPCRAILLEPQPEVTSRVPPIRFRKHIPDCWVELELIEGKYHQVRRMTAAVGHPTLRLIRVRIGAFELAELEPGHWRELRADDRRKVFGPFDSGGSSSSCSTRPEAKVPREASQPKSRRELD